MSLDLLWLLCPILDLLRLLSHHMLMVLLDIPADAAKV